jgi:MerR family transcriptional regulator, copper efflux regulator
MLQRRRIGNLREYLTVKQAAAFLGVSTKTLRNWDQAGSFKPRRHPINGFRLYRRDELQALLEKAARVTRGGRQ